MEPNAAIDRELNMFDPAFCDEVAAVPGGENIRMCFACGTCTAGCPVTAVEERYNPRKIIRQILLGMKEEVLSSPYIWFCQMCYRCYSRCPQSVNFTDIMSALRYLAVKRGYADMEKIKNNYDLEELTQLVRREMIKNADAGNGSLQKEIRARIGK